MIRALAKIALTYAVTRMLARSGGPGGIIDSVFNSGRKPGPQPRARARKAR